MIANQILEHTKEVFWIWHEIARVLAPQGQLILGVPNLASAHNRLLLLLGRQPTRDQDRLRPRARLHPRRSAAVPGRGLPGRVRAARARRRQLLSAAAAARAAARARAARSRLGPVPAAAEAARSTGASSSPIRRARGSRPTSTPARPRPELAAAPGLRAPLRSNRALPMQAFRAMPGRLRCPKPASPLVGYAWTSLRRPNDNWRSAAAARSARRGCWRPATSLVIFACFVAGRAMNYLFSGLPWVATWYHWRIHYGDTRLVIFFALGHRLRGRLLAARPLCPPATVLAGARRRPGRGRDARDRSMPRWCS